MEQRERIKQYNKDLNQRKLKLILKTLIEFLGDNKTFFEFYKSYQKQLENIKDESLATLKFKDLMKNWYNISQNESNKNLTIKEKIEKLQLLSMHIL